MARDKRYESPVAGLEPDDVAERMVQSMGAVERIFPPKTGICVFVFDFGGPGGGLGYIANAERDTMIEALEEWIARAKRPH